MLLLCTWKISHISPIFICHPQVNRVNILHVRASTPLAYGRVLLDIIFSRSELKESIMFRHFKSSKPPLNRQKVDLLFSKLIVTTTEFKWIFFLFYGLCQKAVSWFLSERFNQKSEPKMQGFWKKWKKTVLQMNNFKWKLLTISHFSLVFV